MTCPMPDDRPVSPESQRKSWRARPMDAVSWLLWKLHLYGTCGSWDGWCDNHGYWGVHRPADPDQVVDTEGGWR